MPISMQQLFKYSSIFLLKPWYVKYASKQGWNVSGFLKTINRIIIKNVYTTYNLVLSFLVSKLDHSFVRASVFGFIHN